MIDVDLCRPNYQTLMIIYHEFMIKNAKNAWQEKIRSECKFIGYKNNRLNCRCKECNKLCFKSPNKAVKKFPILYQFCKGDLNKFFLLLGKGYYPYEDADSWEKIDETTIPPTEIFYSELNLEGISDADYVHIQKVWGISEIKNFGITTYMLKAKDYCLQMCLKSLEISVLKYMILIPLIF